MKISKKTQKIFVFISLTLLTVSYYIYTNYTYVSYLSPSLIYTPLNTQTYHADFYENDKLYLSTTIDLPKTNPNTMFQGKWTSTNKDDQYSNDYRSSTANYKVNNLTLNTYKKSKEDRLYINLDPHTTYDFIVYLPLDLSFNKYNTKWKTMSCFGPFRNGKVILTIKQDKIHIPKKQFTAPAEALTKQLQYTISFLKDEIVIATGKFIIPQKFYFDQTDSTYSIIDLDNKNTIAAKLNKSNGYLNGKKEFSLTIKDNVFRLDLNYPENNTIILKFPNNPTEKNTKGTWAYYTQKDTIKSQGSIMITNKIAFKTITKKQVLKKAIDTLNLHINKSKLKYDIENPEVEPFDHYNYWSIAFWHPKKEYTFYTSFDAQGNLLHSHFQKNKKPTTDYDDIDENGDIINTEPTIPN